MSIEALKHMVAELEYVLDCINQEQMPFDGDDFHEALRLGRQAISEAESKRAALDAIIKSSEKRNEEWDALSADEQAAYHVQNACPYCDGSGHKDDIAEAEKQEPLCTAAMFDDAFLAKSGLDPKMPLYTHPQPKREPLTDEQLKPHYQNQEWLDGVRFAEAAHGIKGEA